MSVMQRSSDNVVPDGRLVVGQNRDWRFACGEHPCDEATVDGGSDWFDVGLPHSFAVPADLDTRFYVGGGSYQHVLRIDPEWVGRRTALEFGGATTRNRSAAVVTDPNTAAGWTAPDQEPGHWLGVDLEGPRRLTSIAVTAPGSDPVTVSTSALRRDEGYEPLATGVVDELSRPAVRFEERDVRFIRVEFPQRPLEVLAVEATEEAE
jgi:hypothetical protein